MIFVNGDSFTFGEESSVAWPSILPTTVNIAVPGASNDYIVRSTVEYLENNVIDKAIIAWTTPDRIELGKKHLTPTSQGRYGAICDQVFVDWDNDWAVAKFHAQETMLHGYLSSKGIQHIFVKTFNVPSVDKEYWIMSSMVEWMGDCPKGPGGHPLELGHQRIAKKINEHIRHLGWIS
jgi:hypothetical protein